MGDIFYMLVVMCKKLGYVFYMSWSPDVPYNDLPPAPRGTGIETARVLKAVVPARVALSELATTIQALPNPSVLVNSLALLEAQASSEVENIVTTADDLFKAETNQGDADAATREALRYKTGLFLGEEYMSSRANVITVGLAEDICTHIRGIDTRIRKSSGTFIGNPSTGDRVYTPPEGQKVIEQKMSDWAEFVNQPMQLDPLVQMAVAHYQFEAIHPFEDGNGRTGRILNVLMLVAHQLLPDPVLYLSRYIIRNKAEYYRLLQEVTAEGAWEAWILYMLRAVEVTARSTSKKIRQTLELQDSFVEHLQQRFGSHYPVRLVDVLFEQPYCRVRNVMETCQVARPTATKYLGILVDDGVLEVQKIGRENLYVNTGFINILMAEDNTD